MKGLLALREKRDKGDPCQQGEEFWGSHLIHAIGGKDGLPLRLQASAWPL